MRRASTSLRGALTEAHPRYVSWLNTMLSSSGIGLMGLPSDDDSSAVKRRCIVDYSNLIVESKIMPSNKNLFLQVEVVEIKSFHECLAT